LFADTLIAPPGVATKVVAAFPGNFSSFHPAGKGASPRAGDNDTEASNRAVRRNPEWDRGIGMRPTIGIFAGKLK
jgi:hypothetical protein